MKKTFTLTNGNVVTFEEITAKFCGEETEQKALKLHDEKDEFCDGDCISAIDEMPNTVEEAEQAIEDNYWSTFTMDGTTYIGE